MVKTARENDYADLDLDFTPHPTTKDVYIRRGSDAITRALRNLIMSNFYERPFQSYLGCGARNLLFELATPITINALKDAIVEVVQNYEPRVSLDDVTVSFDYENNGYNVTIRYRIINRNEPVVTGLFLERIR